MAAPGPTARENGDFPGVAANPNQSHAARGLDRWPHLFSWANQLPTVVAKRECAKEASFRPTPPLPGHTHGSAAADAPERPTTTDHRAPAPPALAYPSLPPAAPTPPAPGLRCRARGPAEPTAPAFIRRPPSGRPPRRTRGSGRPHGLPPACPAPHHAGPDASDPWSEAPTDEWEEQPPAPLLLGAALAAYVLLATGAWPCRAERGGTDWFPAAGLAVAAIALGGPRFIAWPFVGTLIAAPLTSDTTSIDGTLVVATALAATYGAGGLLLQRSIDVEHPFSRVQDAWRLIGIGTLLVPVAAALATIGGLIAIGTLPAADTTTSLIGDFILAGRPGDRDRRAGAARGPCRLASRAAPLLAPPGAILLRPESLAALAMLIFATPALYLLGGEDCAPSRCCRSAGWPCASAWPAPCSAPSPGPARAR